MDVSAPITNKVIPTRQRQEAQINHRALYDQYSKAMFNTSLRIVNNRSDAEDILQESFLDAFRGLDGFQSRSTFGAWLKRIVINKSINKVKRQKMFMVTLDQTDQNGIIQEDTVDEQEFEYQIEEIKKGIMQLPTGYRTVFSLRMLENYNFNEIASLLHISTVTARSQYMRAKNKLLEYLKEGGNYEK